MPNSGFRSKATAAAVPAPNIHDHAAEVDALITSQRNRHPAKQAYTAAKLYGKGKQNNDE
jgi:hypothetical protein